MGVSLITQLNPPEILAELNVVSVLLRLLLAAVFGGIIGLERGANRHPAGFRTHILVCVGAALAMLTNQYICDIYGAVSDPARLGAQVITGVGFLGVGTILVTGRHKIKGLTTAAGLWASACLGLSLGIGFYVAAIVAAVLIFVSLSVLPKLEDRVYKASRVMDLYIEMNSISGYKSFVHMVREMGVEVFETHLSKDPIAAGGMAFHMSIKLPKELSHTQVIEKMSAYSGVYLIEEI